MNMRIVCIKDGVSVNIAAYSSAFARYSPYL